MRFFMKKYIYIYIINESYPNKKSNNINIFGTPSLYYICCYIYGFKKKTPSCKPSQNPRIPDLYREATRP